MTSPDKMTPKMENNKKNKLKQNRKSYLQAFIDQQSVIIIIE